MDKRKKAEKNNAENLADLQRMNNVFENASDVQRAFLYGVMKGLGLDVVISDIPAQRGA